MRTYEFKLTPAYCLYNGIAVVKQEGAYICFMAENPGDEILRARLKKAFSNFIEYVLRQQDCPPNFRNTLSVSFVPGNRAEVRKYVSSLYSQPELKISEKNVISENTEKTKKENEAAAVLLLDTLLLEARNHSATDIHIEKNQIQFRVNGKLELYSFITEDKVHELIQRIKFLAGMNVLEKRRSQDGHFVYGKESPVFVRVSVMGVIGNNQNESEESVVIRILDTKRLPLELDKLGFTHIQTEKIKEIAMQKNGLIIICGPTGAGKSTTAAAILIDIKRQRNNAVKIISMEDPPEYVIPGVSQIQIDEKIENSFSEALRHVFRQDPDVLMIGEIRDENTASVAVRAALTGHLVIATLHTSTAAGAILRLENLGVPVNLIVSVLKGVVSQELKPLCGAVALAADVSIPNDSIIKAVENNLVEEELEQYFEHTTNYSMIVEKTLGLLQEKHSTHDNSLKAKKISSAHKNKTNRRLFISQSDLQKEEEGAI